jgi:hypothetical protein
MSVFHTIGKHANTGVLVPPLAEEEMECWDSSGEMCFAWMTWAILWIALYAKTTPNLSQLSTFAILKSAQVSIGW